MWDSGIISQLITGYQTEVSVELQAPVAADTEEAEWAPQAFWMM
jgi:hypothetical protein